MTIYENNIDSPLRKDIPEKEFCFFRGFQALLADMNAALEAEWELDGMGWDPATSWQSQADTLWQVARERAEHLVLHFPTNTGEIAFHRMSALILRALGACHMPEMGVVRERSAQCVDIARSRLRDDHCLLLAEAQECIDTLIAQARLEDDGRMMLPRAA